MTVINAGEVRGTVADGYEPVRDAFLRAFKELGERGAAAAVYRDGRRVVDLWAGAAHADDPCDGPAWAEPTAQIIRSAGKGPAAVCPLLLHQRGLLDLDAPVAAYWPEFRAAGKGGVLVRHLLTHQAGLPALDIPLTYPQALDGDAGPRAVAAQAPQWEPGAAHGYHAQTFSWLLGELVSRVTGRSLGTWFAEEIARPRGLDLWIGLPAAEAGRVGRIAAVPAPEPPAARGPRARLKPSVVAAYADPSSLTRRAFGAIQRPGGAHAADAAGAADAAADETYENDPRYRAAELPASNTIATARSLAAFYAALIDGADGLLTPATLALARGARSEGPDRVLIVNTRFGHGFMLHGPSCPLLGPGSFGHPGRGGSLGFADPESGVAFAYVTNSAQSSVTADPRPQALIRALRSCLA